MKLRNIRQLASGRYQVELERSTRRFSLGTYDTKTAAVAVRDAFLEKERASGKYPRNNQYTARTMELQQANRPQHM